MFSIVVSVLLQTVISEMNIIIVIGHVVVEGRCAHVAMLEEENV